MSRVEERFKEIQRALAEEQTVTERCAHCPDFVIRGPLREARPAFHEHVRLAHPIFVPALDVKRPALRKPQATARDEYGILRRLADIAT